MAKIARYSLGLALALASSVLYGASVFAQDADHLPPWNNGQAKQTITDFVDRVTKSGGADFVPEAQRVAVFDNDGTLWAEQPIYFQLAFAMDRIRAMSKSHPEWADEQPFKAVLKGDQKAFAAAGEKGLLDIVATSAR